MRPTNPALTKALDAVDRMGIIGGRLFRTAAVLVVLAVLMWFFGVQA